VIEAGPIALDPRTYSALIANQPVVLTALQFDLLRFLVQNRERVVDHSEIARAVLGSPFGDTSLLVRVHICHLRKAIKPSERLIATVRGRGYRIVL
jgi:DNA-binding response OmpR family regulator